MPTRAAAPIRPVRSDQIAQLRRRLMRWYRRHARDLPWRRTRDPYAVWVSEIMLQQTQVATVEDYFDRFMVRFPSVAALAAADEADVLRTWEGLGYYRRARSLHAAARIIMSEHNGEFPRDPDVARSLPGIGRYTVGAIMSIALDARLPVLEANTTRLFARLLALREDVGRADVKSRLWEFAEQLLPRRNVGILNQAVMELGSEICTPRKPDCARCPVAMLCPTRAADLTAEIPRMTKKMQYEAVREAALVIHRRGRVLLRQCADGERWAGLWDFPRFAVDATETNILSAELRSKAQQLTGLEIEVGTRLATIKHGVTRYRITLTCHEASCRSGRLRRSTTAPWKWVVPQELVRFPLSATGRKISQIV